MAHARVIAAKAAPTVSPISQPAAPAPATLAVPASDTPAAGRGERLRAGLMLLALLSFAVAFWAAVIGLAARA